MTSQLVPPISIEMRLAGSPGRGAAFERADAGGRAGQDQHHRPVADLVDRHRAAVALQQQQRARQAELAQLLVEARADSS